MTKEGFSFIGVALALLAALAGCIVGDAEAVEEDHAQHAEQRGLDGTRELPSHITGVIIDSELFPIAEVDVGVTPGDHVVLTDLNGTFIVGPLEPGTYTVAASKRGYAANEQQVNVVADKETDVRMTLQGVASDVPYHETLTRSMFLYCAFSLHFGHELTGFLQTSAPCAGLADIAVQTATGSTATNSLDTWTFDFVIDKFGFQSLVMEMVWPPQQFGADGLMQLTELATAQTTSGGGVTIGGTNYGGSMAQPYHDVIHAGNSYWVSGGENVTFYPEPNSTRSYQMIIAGYYGNTSVPAGESAVFINFRPTVYLTFFYNRQATPEFTILPPE